MASSSDILERKSREPVGAVSASSTVAATDAPGGRRTLGLGLLGAVACYLAHPPVDWGLLAWIGPVPWLLLARAPRMPGRRPYRALWLCGMAFWLATVQWIRLPHPANIFGLFLLAGYLGAYLPVFVGLVRVAVHRVGVPLWLAAPVVWTGLEWVRARLLTGFLMASLAHTQVEYPWVIQIADVFGEYGVTFLIVLVAAAMAEALPPGWLGLGEAAGDRGHRPRRYEDRGDEPRGSLDRGDEPRGALVVVWKLAPAVVALGGAVGYGGWRLQQDVGIATPQAGDGGGPVVALVQSNQEALWKGDANGDSEVMTQQVELSRKARQAAHAAGRPLDLIVWPETMFRVPLHMADGEYRPPAELFGVSVEAVFAGARDYLSTFARDMDAAVLVGVDRTHWKEPPPGTAPAIAGMPPFSESSYNSSACVDRTGKLVGTYDKMHLLPFGEFIPFVDWLPFLRNYSPITGLAQPGEGPAALKVEGVVYAPNICYETVLPHLIRRQVLELAGRGETPDVLVNLTNDAWYWGSSELDMHLASGVFRAVEMRRPLVVAANRGLSAHVDHMGRVVAVSERNVPAFVIAKVRLPADRNYLTPFARWGEWLALGCLVCCLVLAAVGSRRLRRGAGDA